LTFLLLDLGSVALQECTVRVSIRQGRNSD
jgi:hypothetical protein